MIAFGGWVEKFLKLCTEIWSFDQTDVKNSLIMKYEHWTFSMILKSSCPGFGLLAMHTPAIKE